MMDLALPAVFPVCGGHPVQSITGLIVQLYPHSFCNANARPRGKKRASKEQNLQTKSPVGILGPSFIVYDLI